MAVIRVKKNKNYTVMSNYHLQDSNLTLAEKGLLSIIYSLPDDWDYSIRGLAKYLNMEKTSISRIIKKLRQRKYITLEKKRNKKGHIFYEYTIFEKPAVINNPCPQKPHTVNVDTTNILKNKELDSNIVLSYINSYSNNLESKKELEPSTIKDKTTLFNYFVNFDSINFDKYTKLYFKLRTETDHNLFIIFSYVFTKIKELDKIEIKDPYRYVEKSVYNNIEKLDFLESIDTDISLYEL